MGPGRDAMWGRRDAYLKGDKRFIFSAAAHAQRAADYLHSLQSANSNGTANEVSDAAD